MRWRKGFASKRSRHVLYSCRSLLRRVGSPGLFHLCRSYCAIGINMAVTTSSKLILSVIRWCTRCKMFRIDAHACMAKMPHLLSCWTMRLVENVLEYAIDL